MHGYLSVGEVAERLGVNSVTVTRWCKAGTIPAFAKQYGHKTTYQISIQAVEQFQHQRAQKVEAKQKQEAKPHNTYVTRWLTALERGGIGGRVYSPTTRALYQLYVEDYLKHHPMVSVQGVQKELMKAGALHYSKRSNMLKALVCFSKFLLQHNVCDEKLLNGLASLKPKRHLPPKRTSIDPADMAKLIEACETLEDRLIILLLSSTGIRASEACALQWRHVDLERRVMTIELGKGNKTRLLGIPEPSVMPWPTG